LPPPAHLRPGRVAGNDNETAIAPTHALGERSATCLQQQRQQPNRKSSSDTATASNNTSNAVACINPESHKIRLRRKRNPKTLDFRFCKAELSQFFFQALSVLAAASGLFSACFCDFSVRNVAENACTVYGFRRADVFAQKSHSS
jgi:hypothetical protein